MRPGSVVRDHVSASFPSAHEQGWNSCRGAGTQVAAWSLRQSVPGRGPRLGMAEGSAHDPAQLSDPGSSRAGDQPGADSADPGRPSLAQGLPGRPGRQPRGGAAGGRARHGTGCTRVGRWLGLDAVPFHGREGAARPATAVAGRDPQTGRVMRGANRRPPGRASAAGGRGLALLRSSPPGWRSPARCRPGVSRDGPGRRRPVPGSPLAPRRRRRAGPGGPRPRGHGRCRRSSCHRCRSRQAKGSGPAACLGRRQPQPDARHCERHFHGDGDDQAGGHALLR